MERNKVMMIVIIVLLVVLLGAIVGISLYVLNTVQNEQEEIPSMTPPPALEVAVEDLKFVEVPSSSTNLFVGADGKSHNVRATFGIGLNSTLDEVDNDHPDGAFYDLFNEKIGIAQDIILSTLRHTTYEETREAVFEDKIKEEILTKLRDKFQSVIIWEVNIIDFATTP